MNFKTSFYKIVFCICITFSFSSCIHLKSTEENLHELKTRQVAMVISGCKGKYTKHNFIFSDEDKKTSCTTHWKSSSGEKLRLSGYRNLSFVLPGTYEFEGFYYIGDGIQYYYFKKNGPSILTKFSVKGGEVVYIGDLNIDTRGSKQIIRAITPVYYKDSLMLKYLTKIYPLYFNNKTNLAKKFIRRNIRLTPVAAFAKNMLPTIEKAS